MKPYWGHRAFEEEKFIELEMLWWIFLDPSDEA